MAAAVEAGGRVTGTAFGDVGVSRSAAGVQVLDGRDKGHWAKVTARGTGNHYAHIHAVPKGDGTFIDLPTGTDGSIWGTTTSLDAREVNGRVDFDAALPLYAWLEPDPTEGTPGFVFAGPGSSIPDQTTTAEWDALTAFDADTCTVTSSHFTLTLTVTGGVIALSVAVT